MRLLAEIEVKGIVQGVGFRPFVYRTAVTNGLFGYVQNRGDATVKIVVEGERNNIEQFLRDLRQKKPPLVKLYEVSIDYSQEAGKFDRFVILESSKAGDKTGSVIPPDVSICDECLTELRTTGNRRHKYFFITCTNCGPRFTIIRELPYDRPRTTMAAFLMCEECRDEYFNPLDRRFHAQTVACAKCGPKTFLTASDGEHVDCGEPILEAGKLVGEGYIVAVKGNGGFHIATATTLSEPVIRLRRTKHRAQKPFAIMARDLETTKTFAIVTDKEAELLTSYIKPIVLLTKSEDYYLSEWISPGLHNMGVMLPYTGLHTLLFDGTSEPALVMTSGNPPGEPLAIENDEALERLGPDVDFFLFHNRRIAQRCDDPVVRFTGGQASLIRRSRGYAPEPVHLKKNTGKCVLALGGELNVTACILIDDKAYLSQHIGNIEQIETFQFLKDAVSHMLNLTKGKVQAVACDLHPKFLTTRLAHDFQSTYEWQLIQVQHHHTHIASVMGEHGLEETVGIACDGVGFGPDGTIWGGEIMHCTRDSYKRLAHLQEQPMVGGDLATKYPIRMVVGMLHKSREIEGWLLENTKLLPHSEEEAELILQQLKRGKSLKTTSCGRVLDAVSAVLGVCYERTYEGEPAMKLESKALGGRDVLNLKSKVEKDILDTSFLLEEIFDNVRRVPTVDLAFSAQSYIGRGLAEIAVEKAKELGVKTTSFSGGVAYNGQITETIRQSVEDAGIQFFTNIQVPPGDGGVSFGQVIIGSLQH